MIEAHRPLLTSLGSSKLVVNHPYPGLGDDKHNDEHNQARYEVVQYAVPFLRYSLGRSFDGSFISLVGQILT